MPANAMNPTHQPATAQQIERLRELEAKATPGPWALGKGIYTVREESKPGWQGFVARTHIAGDPMNKQAEENAELIAESRNLLPALLNSHAALVDSVKKLSDLLNHIDSLAGFKTENNLTYDQLFEHIATHAEIGLKIARAALATAEEKPRK